MARRRTVYVAQPYRLNPIEFEGPIYTEEQEPPARKGSKSDPIDDIERSIGSLMAGAGSALRDVNDDAGQWLQGWGNEIVTANPADYGSIDEIHGLGDLAGFAFERAMEFVPQFAGAVGASLAGSPLAGLAVLAAPTAVSTYGGARQSQREQGVYDPLLAGAVGLGAGALEALGVGRVLLGKGALVKEVFEQGLLGAAKQGAKTAGEEALTEVGQTALQRYGGYQDLTSPEAIKEYAFSGLAGGILGGGIGAGRAALAPSTAEAMPAEEGIAAVQPISARAPIETVVPPEIAQAEPLNTIIVENANEAGETVRESLDILSEPNEEGDVWVRTPEGEISQMPQALIQRMAGTYTPTFAAEVEEPAITPGETPGTFTTTTVINGVPVTTTGLTPEPVTTLPVGEPIDITEPAPEATAPEVTTSAPEAAPAAPEIVATAPEVEAPSPSISTAAPEVAIPEAAPIGVEPAAEPAPIATAEAAPAAAPTPAPEPEQYVFTPEKAKQLSTENPQLAQDLIGKTVSGGAQMLAQRTQSPFYRKLANRVAGVAQAMERSGVQLPIRVSGFDGGMASSSYQVQKSLETPGNAGVVSPFPLVPQGPYNYFEVGIKGKPDIAGVSGANEETVLHEMLHSATTGAQRMAGKFPTDSRMGKALKEMKRLHKTVLSGIGDIKSGKLDVSDDVRSSLARLDKTNAFVNERELLAWGMSNYDMQNVLKAIPTKKGSAFTEFVEAVAKMLGVGPNDYNALRNLIELTEAVIPTENAAQQEMIDVVTGKIAPKKKAKAAPKKSGDQMEAEVDVSQRAEEEVAPEPEVGAPRRSLNLPLGDETRVEKIRRKVESKNLRQEVLEGAIAKARGEAIPRGERPSTFMALYEGRTAPRLEELENDYLKQALKIMKDWGITRNQFDQGLIARAANDRNAKIARRNPDMPDGGIGVTNAEAARDMMDIAKSGKVEGYKKLFKLYDKMMAQNRKLMVESGEITQQQADALVAEEPFYVPAKGFSVDGDFSEYLDSGSIVPRTGRGFTTPLKPYMSATGRRSLPFSPFSNAFADASASIIRSERNRVGKSFLKMAQENPSSAYEIYTEDRPEYEQRFDKRTGRVVKRPVDMTRNTKDYLVVKKDGKAYYIKINDDILKRTLLNGSSEDFSAVNKVLGNTIGALTRTFSTLHTTLNPEFVITNAARDIQSAVFNILAEQQGKDGVLLGKNIVKGVLKDIRSRDHWSGLRKAIRSHDATTVEQQNINALYKQAREDGAFTGWMQYSTPEDIAKNMNKALKDAESIGAKKLWYSTKAGIKGVMNVIQDYNSVVENSIRFSVYKRAIEAGLSRDEAAYMSRNVTVDFNRKGEFGPTINALYAFYNASIQGTGRLLRSLAMKTPDGKYTMAQKAAIGMIGLGILQSMIGHGMSEEDKDGTLFYDKIPEWEKDRNFIFMLPDGKEYIKIPMPYGYSFLHNMGTKMTDTMLGYKSKGDTAVGLFNALMNNFMPVPLSFNSWKSVGASAFPTVLRPVADLMANENFFGSEIYNEPFNKDQASSSVSRYSTPEGYKAVVEWLNELTGGKGKVAGAVDIPAESLQYLVNYYVGSAGKFGFDSISAIYDAAKGRDVPMKDAPLFRKLLGEPNTQNDLGIYYDRIGDIASVERQLRDSTGAERRDVMEKFPVESNPRLISAMKQAQKQLKAANKIKRNLLDRDMDDMERQERLDKLDERIHNTYLRFNGVYNQVKEREE